MKIKKRKIRYRSRKDMGHPEDSWARLGGRHGKKRSYGHFSGYAENRSLAEKRNADDLRDEEST